MEPTTTPNPPVDITVLVCTFNRCGALRELLASALAQETGGDFTFEVLVVDNNSTDLTRLVVEGLIADGHTEVRYLFEAQQGKSFALNTGLSAARGAFIATADDDLLLPPDYLRRIWQAFQAHPQLAVVGGKVLPLWQGTPPAWLTQAHWSALALCDYGTAPIETSVQRPICLLAGAFRRAAVEEVGGYHTALSVTKGQIGGTEDVDLLRRLYEAGYAGLYVPELWLLHKVVAERLTKPYHRRWHKGHGRFYATMRDPELERASARLFDVPSHLYRQAIADAFAWARHAVRGQSAEAFLRETRLQFFTGFWRARYDEVRAVGGGSLPRKLTALSNRAGTQD